MYFTGEGCKDRYTYIPGLCLWIERLDVYENAGYKYDPTQEYNYESDVPMRFRNVSVLACERLCTKGHPATCSGVLYYRYSKTKWVWSWVWSIMSNYNYSLTPAAPFTNMD